LVSVDDNAIKKTKLKDIHHFGLRRLYCGPSLLMILPRMTKFAARSGVGPIIVAVILETKCHGLIPTGFNR
jgi:hypothetical protein